MNEQWKEIFSNEKLLREILPVGPEEAQKILKDNGYTISLEEIKEVGKEIENNIIKIKNGELSEDDLENVAGGASGWGHTIATVAGFAVGALMIAGGVW